jgi:hypothetical protein
MLLAGPKFTPRACATSIPSGFIETAMRLAISVFRGELGIIAANIRMTAPTHVIMGKI